MSWILDAKEHTAPPRSRQGHVCASIKDKLYVWGGYSVLENGQVEFSGSEMSVYNMTADSWSSEKAQEEHAAATPATRTGASMVCTWGDMLVAFGGFVSNSAAPHSNDVFFYDTNRKQWLNTQRSNCETRAATPDGEYKIHVLGNAPSPRDKHTACMYKNRMIVFGGWGPNPNNAIDDENFDEDPTNNRLGWNNEVHVLDVSHLSDYEVTWSKPEIKGTPPAPRAAHSMCVFGNMGVVFGGRTRNGRRNDIHILNFDTWEWTGPLACRGDLPPERSWHCATMFQSQSLFVFGGLGKDTQNNSGMSLGDAWVLNMKTQQWAQLDKPTASGAARLWHTCVNAPGSGQVLIFGGTERLDMQTATNRLLRYRYSVPRLTVLCLDAIAQNNRLLCSAGLLPAHLKTQLSVRVGGRPMPHVSRHPAKASCVIC